MFFKLPIGVGMEYKNRIENDRDNWWNKKASYIPADAVVAIKIKLTSCKSDSEQLLLDQEVFT